MVRISQRKREKSYSDQTQKPAKEKLEQLREILRYFNQILHTFPPWETRDKDKENSNAGTTGKGAESAHEAHQAAQDLSRKRAAAIDKLVAEAIARESAQLTATFTAILKQNSTANMPTSLKVSSGAAGIKAMPPFDWTKDKAIYQR